MKVIPLPNFSRIIKKLHNNQKLDLDKAITEIINNPLIGERKIGDLNGVRVYKFKMVNQLTLVAYDYYEDKEEIVLLFLGSHENFYNELKKIK